MDFQTTTPPSYYIYREGSVDDAFDPTTPLQFFPAKDSDELFFALRSAYPNVTTHSERMRNAVIDFLMSEGQAQQQAASSQVSPVMAMDNSMFYDSGSMSSNSPHNSMASSSSGSSPQYSTYSPAAQSFQISSSQASVAASQSTPALDDMTGVFTLTSHSKPKMRSRRKMTESEKVEYRKRRSAGACQSCSSRKRKCSHKKDAVPAVVTTSTDANLQRVIKPLAKKETPQALRSTAPIVSAGPPLSSKPLFNFDGLIPGDLLSFDDAELFPAQEEADWTLLDFDGPTLSSSNIPRSARHYATSLLSGSAERDSSCLDRQSPHRLDSGTVTMNGSGGPSLQTSGGFENERLPPRPSQHTSQGVSTVVRRSQVASRSDDLRSGVGRTTTGLPVLFGSQQLGLDDMPADLAPLKRADGISLGIPQLGSGSNVGGFSLEEFLISVGEFGQVQLCIICAMLSSLPRLYTPDKGKPVATIQQGSAMDELSGLCSRLQLAGV